MKKNLFKDFKKIIDKGIFVMLFGGLALAKVSDDFFYERIDAIVVFLVVMAFLPWLSQYLKSLEAFGVKAELVTPEQKKLIEEQQKKLKSSDVVEQNNSAKRKSRKKNDSPFEDFLSGQNDPIIILVAIRYEIEKKLVDLAKKRKVHFENRSLRNLVIVLRNNEILSNEICNLILDVLPILNKAVHSDIRNCYFDDLQWVIDKGTLILKYLDSIS